MSTPKTATPNQGPTAPRVISHRAVSQPNNPSRKKNTKYICKILAELDKSLGWTPPEDASDSAFGLHRYIDVSAKHGDRKPQGKGHALMARESDWMIMAVDGVPLHGSEDAFQVRVGSSDVIVKLNGETAGYLVWTEQDPRAVENLLRGKSPLAKRTRAKPFDIEDKAVKDNILKPGDPFVGDIYVTQISVPAKVSKKRKEPDSIDDKPEEEIQTGVHQRPAKKPKTNDQSASHENTAKMNREGEEVAPSKSPINHATQTSHEMPIQHEEKISLSRDEFQMVVSTMRTLHKSSRQERGMSSSQRDKDDSDATVKKALEGIERSRFRGVLDCGELALPYVVDGLMKQ